MSHTNKLYRNFIILQEDKRGDSSLSDKTLSGYSKIEAKGDRCKISFYAQNLRKDSEDYCIMLICNKNDSKDLINLGRIVISDGGKAEITKEYLSNNIAGVGVTCDRISGTAIAKIKEGSPVFLMYGFINGEQPADNWKNYKVTKANQDNIELRTVQEVSKKEKSSNIQKKDVKKDIKKDVKKDKEEIRENILNEEKIISNNIEVDEDVKDESKNTRDRSKFEEYESTIKSEVDEFKIIGSVGEYFEGIANGFEYCKDAYSEIKYCKWYKVMVNDLYEMCNMSNYNKYTVAYYPMLNYYPYIKKYGYFMLGYKCDSKGNLKYIVYGIPGKKDKDDQPYEGKTGFVTWVSDEEDSEMGSWLMFYDFKSSTVVVPMQ